MTSAQIDCLAQTPRATYNARLFEIWTHGCGGFHQTDSLMSPQAGPISITGT
jgi:hypothetical protein